MKTAQILRELREARNLSQDEIARALGIDRTTYVKYEHGGSIKRNLPKLADFFHVSTDYLLGRSGNMGYDRILHEGTSAVVDDSLGGHVSEGYCCNTPCSRHESSLMRKYRILRPEHKKAVDIQIEYFHSIDSQHGTDI